MSLKHLKMGFLELSNNNVNVSRDYKYMYIST